MIPALEKKLETNHAPTPDEIVIIKHGLLQTEEQLRSLSTRINQLQNYMEQLYSEQQRLITGISMHRRMLSPARRLVPDILREIFYHCLPIYHNSTMSHREPPLLLCQVCSHWRQVATSTPRLWASIHIAVPSGKIDSTTRVTHNTFMLLGVASWLSRSGVLPLSISLHSSILSTILFLPTNVEIRPFLDIITPFASRWKSISLKLENYDWTEFFNRFDTADVPVLETLHLEGTQVLGPVSGDLQPPGFEAVIKQYGIFCAPQIRSISIPRFAVHLLQLPVRWAELTELDISNGGLTSRDFLKALASCPQLIRCSITRLDWNRIVEHDELYTLQKVVLPRLEVLLLKDEIAVDGRPTLLECLVAPQLCHLSFCRTIHPEPSFLIRAVGAFCLNLLQPLQEFELEVDYMSAELVMKVLELLPGLKRLSLRSSGKPEASPEQGPYMPYWTSSRLFHFTDEPLRRFIPKVVNVREVHQVDETFPSPGWQSDSSTDSNVLHPSFVGLFNSSPDTFDSESKVVVNRLCPNLEVFHCSGAMFSESCLLEVLRSRCLKYHQLGIAHLRIVTVSFVTGRKKSLPFNDEIISLAKQTGTCVYLNYSEPLNLPPVRSSPLTSPYQGIENSNYLPMHFGFW